ncbi:Transmembrane protease serine [Trichinella pseudospiralis]
MPVPHNQYGLPICIPKSTDQLPIGKRCWTTGWGRSVDYEMSPRLKMVPSPLIHPRRCGIKKFESWFCICGGMLDENNIPAEKSNRPRRFWRATVLRDQWSNGAARNCQF